MGRITQVGQKPQTQAMTQVISQDVVALQSWIDNKTNGGGLKEQITRTVYDVSYYVGDNVLNNNDPTLHILKQSNLRNRVSYTQIINQEPANGLEIYAGVQAAATYYSYDIHGNVDTLVQDLNQALSSFNNRYKKMVYDYDLISGKVNKVAYQPRMTDQFYHKYGYDAENRITKVLTSHDSIYWEQDATYDYYRHGPLSRSVLGQNQVQGIDYTYTIQGWLKGVNSTSVNNGSFDMGADGFIPPSGGGGASTVARDAYGYSLNYFNGDYKPINTITNPFVNITNNLPAAADGVQLGKDLFNGNIRGMMVNIPALALAAGNGGLLYAYRYDQLNRIKAMNSFTGFDNATNQFANSNIPAVSENYKERLAYDPNGNIKSYLRNGTTVGGTAQQMDALTYGYNITSGNLQNNKLRHVKDAIGNANYTEDIDDQADDNYSYDAIGNLTADVKEGISNITWSVYGKIQTITKTNGTNIAYTYDASGNRISKTVTGGTAAGTTYVRDASGNVMSIYGTSSSINAGAFTQTEISVYGSSRFGVWNLNRNATSIQYVDFSTYSGSFTRGNKLFELSNHLGNVLVTISDKKIGVDATPADGIIDYYTADVVTANDYYPFGMQMPGRKYSNSAGAYRYGFNGKENDNEVKGEGNQQDYGMRIYDSRIGKFLTVDPITVSYPMLTPYQFASNSPIGGIDKDGLEFYFAGGAGNDQSSIGKNGYIEGMITAFVTASISNVVKVAAHKSRSEDIDFSLGAFATTPYNKIMVPNVKYPPSDAPSFDEPYYPEPSQPLKKAQIDDRMVSSVNQVKSKRIEGKQLNLAGYSAGSVVMAQTALLLADENIRVDNLILIGTPIDANSDLGKTLHTYVQAGKIGKIMYISSIGDEVAGLASKTPAEIENVKSNIKNTILQDKMNKYSDGKVGKAGEVIHLRIAGDKTDNKANVTRKEVAEKIKKLGVE